MGRPKKEVAEEVQAEEVVEREEFVVDRPQVEFHFDKDPNDPRLQKTPLLPSLDDEGQS